MGYRGFAYALDFCGGTTKRSLTSAELAPRVPLLHLSGQGDLPTCPVREGKRPMSRAEVSADPTVLPWYFPNQVILNRNRNPELVEITKTGNLVLSMKLF